MRIANTPGFRYKARLLLCVAAFAIGMLGVYFISKSHHALPFKQMAGYDFSQHMNQDWSGPKAGERLDLQRFAGRGREKITDAVDGEIFMLATVDPDCAAGWAARDVMYDVRTHIAEANVPYILVSVTTSRSPDQLFKYTESLGVGAPAFLWSSKEASPPDSLFTMVVPSHILVRRDGTILHTWPGTSQSKKIRFQMVNQIIADTIEIASKQ